jgi:hypothetical protein
MEGFAGNGKALFRKGLESGLFPTYFSQTASFMTKILISSLERNTFVYSQ